MKIYEIPVAIRMCFDEAFVDEETGELIFDAAALAEVCESAEAKISNTARYIREQEHEIEAMKEAAKNILDRAKAKQNKLEWLKRMTIASIDALGKPVEEADIRVTTRKTEAVEIDEEVLSRDWFVRKETWAPNKLALKHALKNNEPVEGARLVTNLSLQIK